MNMEIRRIVPLLCVGLGATCGHAAEPTEPSVGMPVDGGEYLRGLTGVSGTRMGGHGIDPIIRGQSQTRINILLDGAYVHGGCPNRMDPPSAYAAARAL